MSGRWRKARVVPAREGYDRWAAVYDSDGNPMVALEEPLVRALLGPVRGRRVADVGCGTGRHAVALAARGARVDAFDFSEGMIGKARRKPGAERVRFVRHDRRKRLPVPSRAFDRVLCCLVLEHVRDLRAFFRELARLVKPRGSVIVTAMHPSMWLRGKSARFIDPATGADIRPRSFPHTIADAVLAATAAGLRFDRMGEHSPDERLARRFPRARKYVGWPMLLTMRLAPEAR